MTNDPWLRVALAVVGVMSATALAQARVPFFALSGDLRDSVGNPVNATTNLWVRLYDSSAAPISTALHTENFPATAVVRGQFHLQVGSTVPLQQARLFNRADAGAELWVGIQVDGEGEMTPRMRVNSAPWALSVDWSGLTGVPTPSCPPAQFLRAIDATGVPTCGPAVASVTAGSGLTGGTITGTGTIGLASSVQSWPSQPSCPAGQFVRSISTSGAPTCAADSTGVTSVTAGAGLTGGTITTTGTLGLASTVQNWASQPTCGLGQYLRGVTATGAPTCTGAVTSVIAGPGLTGGTITTTGTIGLGTVPVANGGTGSTTQNFVDLTSNQSIAGNKNFTGRIGVGVAAPANELAISAPSPAIQLTSTANNYGSIYFYEGATLQSTVQSLSPTYATASRRGALELYNNNSTGPVSIWTSATERVRVEAGGQVDLSLSVADGGIAFRVESDYPGSNGIARFENTAATAANFASGISVTDNGGPRTVEIDLIGATSGMPIFAPHVGYAILNTNGTPGLDLTTTNANGVIRFFPAGLATERMRINNLGRVGIGTTNPASALDLGGGCMTGTVCSDARLKANISPLREPVINRVMRVEPSTFVWKGRADQKKTIGVIAQQVETVFPEVVGTSADGQKGIECTGLTAIALKAIQEQQVQLRQQQAQLDALQRKLEALSRARQPASGSPSK